MPDEPSAKRKVASILFFDNGNVAVCDQHGQQMADLQAPPWMVFLADLRRRGLLPDDAMVEGFWGLKSKASEMNIPDLAWAPRRRRLPDERQSVTIKFTICNHDFYATIGKYPDGTPGELFLTCSKEGSTLRGLLDSFAITFSLSLQFGVPLADLCVKFRGASFEPSGFTGRDDIPYAKSPMDFIAKYMALNFLDPEGRVSVPEVPMVSLPPPPPAPGDDDGPLCANCGHVMRLDASGVHVICANCGAKAEVRR